MYAALFFVGYELYAYNMPENAQNFNKNIVERLTESSHNLRKRSVDLLYFLNWFVTYAYFKWVNLFACEYSEKNYQHIFVVANMLYHLNFP